MQKEFIQPIGKWKSAIFGLKQNEKLLVPSR